VTEPLTALEREVKFSAWPGFEVPDLSDILSGCSVEPPTEISLDAVYYDTKSLRLIRAGISVRHRTEGPTARWTVKFPEPGDDQDVLVRREVSFERPADTVPSELLLLVRALVRSEVLEPVARLQTRRRTFQLVGDDGVRLGEIDDDEVSVLDAERIAARFREIEVELSDPAPSELLSALCHRLVVAGAGAADPTPKLVRALGPRALAPPDLVPLESDPKASAGEVLQRGITNAVLRVLDHHHVICLDDDIEGVHQARVGTRRLRSDLRTFRPLLRQEWSEPLRRDLGWLANQLGLVRDADVLLGRLVGDTESLVRESDRVEARALLGRLERRRSEALEELLVSLDSARYVDLLDRLVDAAHDPRVRGKADKPARDVLPKLVAIPWRRLRAAVRALPVDPADEQLHRIRIHVKRARYAADVAVPVMGSSAGDFARELAGLQDVLGDHQDAAIAERWLREASLAASPSEALAAGQLIAIERARAAEVSEAFPAHWATVDRKKLTSWLP
jgi:CHAD domain-containing protein